MVANQVQQRRRWRVSLLAVVGSFVAWLLAGPWLEPGIVHVGSPPWRDKQTEHTRDLDEPTFSRTTFTFACSGTTCEGWLYLPKAASPRQAGPLPPLVLMSNGFGGQKDFGLHRYASAFASDGLAAVVTDYRGYGGSDGTPRQWVSARRNRADLRDALAAVRGQLFGAVDASRLVLWGTSFSAGQCLLLAAAPDVAPLLSAVVAQMPHLDPGHAVSSSLASRGHWKSLRMLAAGLLDVTRGALGLAPVYLPLVGPPGSLAFLQMSEQQLQQYWSNHPAIPQGGWLNVGRAAYTIEHTFLRTRPISAVGSIIVPVLYVGAAHDDVCPLSLIEAAAAATPHAEIEMVPADHFNFFQAHHLGPLLKKQAAFIWRHVGMEAGSGADDAVAAAAETQLQHAEL